jgi:hypothetical protein
VTQQNAHSGDQTALSAKQLQDQSLVIEKLVSELYAAIHGDTKQSPHPSLKTNNVISIQTGSARASKTKPKMKFENTEGAQDLSKLPF